MAAKPKKKSKAKTKAGGKTKRPPSAKGYLERLQAMDKSGGFAMYGDDSDIIPVIDEWVSTGCIALDRQLGGGWPIGAISELRAWEGVGKSTVADQSLAYMQSIGGIAALIDTEKSRDRKWSERLGVDLSKLLMKPCDSLEDSYDAIDALLSVQRSVLTELNKGRRGKKKQVKPPPMLIIWDSLGSSPTKAELEGAPGDNHVGVGARRTRQNLRRLTQRLYKLRVGLVIVNHVYTPIGFGSTQLQSPGGGGIKFHTHVRAHMSRTSSLKIGEQVVGHTIEFKNLKNRILGVQQPVEAALIYGVGVDNAYSLFLWGQENGVAEGHRWVIRQGQWSWLYPPGEEPISFQRQYLGLGEILRQRPDLYQWMLAHFMGRYENEKNSEENEREETEA